LFINSTYQNSFIEKNFHLYFMRTCLFFNDKFIKNDGFLFCNCFILVKNKNRYY